MRPVKLVMEGFGAYRDRTEVDFDGVDLFALTGPTGAGKSTVVDAICMALYGSVPRYDDQRLIAPAISQGLAEATVYLDFLVEGVPYTAVRQIRRTPTGGAATKEARLERSGEVLASGGPELTDRITELLGLSFEHFTRCVVLPQGQFAKFLHDRPKDRQELLKNLLDITVYERVASAARDRAKEAKARANAATERLTELASATPERRDELSGRAALLNFLYQTVSAEETALRTLTADAVDATEMATSLAATVTLLESVAVPPTVAELSSAITRNREERQATEVEAIQIATALAERERDLAALGDVTELRMARQAHAALAELDYATPERRAELVARLTALEALYVELQADEAETAALAAKATTARTDADAGRVRATTLEKLEVPGDVVTLDRELTSLATRLASAEKISLVADALVAERQAALDLLGDSASLNANRRSLERRGALTTHRDELETLRAEAQQSLDTVRQDEDAARALHESARRDLDETKVAHQAHALRPHLVVGEPCPVCEQTVDTLPVGELPAALAKAQSAETDAAKAVKKTEAATKAAATELQRVEITATGIATQIADIDATVDSSQTIEAIDTQLAAIARAASDLAGVSTERAVAEQEMALLRAEDKQLRTRETKARGAFLRAHSPVSMMGAPIPSGEHLLSDWQALVAWAVDESATQGTRASTLAAEAEHTEVDVTQRRESARERGEQLGVTLAKGQLASEATFGAAKSAEGEVARLDDALTAIDRHREALRVFAGQHPTNDASLAAIDAQLARVATALAATAEAKTHNQSVKVRLDALRTEHTKVQDEEASARHELSQTHAELAGLGAPVPAGRDIRSDWDTLVTWAQTEAPIRSERASELSARAERLVGEQSRRQGELVAQCEQAGVHPTSGQPLSEAMFAAAQRAADDVERIDEQLAKVAELRASVIERTGEAAVADDLAKLLQANQFEKWLLDDVMTQLVEGATITLMELSGDQFSLAYDDGDFMVIDHKNADQQRQAKTLSGGETFLASLSLALSLADQLASFATGKTVTLDALFLDEGFGTLDADTLDVVASAIEDLGSRGRMVGLISHVPELADRVPVRFEVRKIANASHITKVLQ
ncbi:MAG: SMC family ATPase [Acidimicrobiales bacterium]